MIFFIFTFDRLTACHTNMVAATAQLIAIRFSDFGISLTFRQHWKIVLHISDVSIAKYQKQKISPVKKCKFPTIFCLLKFENQNRKDFLKHCVVNLHSEKAFINFNISKRLILQENKAKKKKRKIFGGSFAVLPAASQRKELFGKNVQRWIQILAGVQKEKYKASVPRNWPRNQ